MLRRKHKNVLGLGKNIGLRAVVEQNDTIPQQKDKLAKV